MKKKRIHIVFTTIFIPHLLKELRDNAARFGHLEETKVWVIGDRKSPPETAQVVAEANKGGLETIYLDIAAQDEWGRRVPEFYRRIPYNNETRRNIAYLCALEDGCDILLCIDDDNFPTEDDFIGGHLRTGSLVREPVLSEPAGFHNVCEHLTFEPDRLIYPRGFPFHLRGTLNAARAVEPPSGVKLGVIAGLWLREPDVDATTWLNGRITSNAYTGPDLVVLAQDTWTPINTQNTSIPRALIPGFLCIPMGFDVPGGKIQRYGDIWGGYFLQAVMQGLPYLVGFGRPLVDHRRNPHNYVDDLRQEFWGLILTDWLLQLLRSDFRSAATDPVTRVEELAEFLRTISTSKLPGWAPEQVKNFVFWTADNLSTWARACRNLGV